MKMQRGNNSFHSRATGLIQGVDTKPQSVIGEAGWRTETYRQFIFFAEVELRIDRLGGIRGEEFEVAWYQLCRQLLGFTAALRYRYDAHVVAFILIPVAPVKKEEAK